ncbi:MULTISPECIES: flagellar assembly protein FliX [Sphingomonas]|uniref:flagellar assembly protein FliX n=1 Tax=Sphingomonas TaxID=13687 RepID=UPI0024136F8D|nr:flagellar assembly protein FliX [Sphingomonas echinoides]
MRITGLSPPIQTLLLTALPKVAQFATAEAAVLPPTPAAAAAQPVSVEMLVTLATVEPSIDRRRRVSVDADRGLRALERLEAALAAGLPAVEPLQEVAAWSAEQRAPEDPQLAGIVRDLELRVRIELAKHEFIV